MPVQVYKHMFGEPMIGQVDGSGVCVSSRDWTWVMND